MRGLTDGNFCLLLRLGLCSACGSVVVLQVQKIARLAWASPAPKLRPGALVQTAQETRKKFVHFDYCILACFVV